MRILPIEVYLREENVVTGAGVRLEDFDLILMIVSTLSSFFLFFMGHVGFSNKASNNKV